jgi:amino acid transporter
LTATANTPAPGDDRTELPRVLTLRDATMLVVSSVIGVGIFLTPGGVADKLPDPTWFFVAWIAGGLLALAGALANAELGAMFPKAGGNYVYLTAAYHPAAGFLVGWLSFFASFAGTVATLAVGFTISLGSFVELGPTTRNLVAVAIIWIATAANAYATKAGALVNTFTGYLKIAVLLSLVILGPIIGHARAAEHPFAQGAAHASIGAFAAALSPVIFSYLGWNASTYVAGEIEKPGKNLPRSLFLGLGICTAIYFLVMWAYVYALGIPKLAATGAKDAVPAGFAVGSVLFGAMGGRIINAMMLLSIFGSLSANVLVGPRIAYAMASDGLFPRAIARLSETAKTPWVAVVLQSIAATFLVIGFGQDIFGVLDYTTFAIVLATIADTSALYVLRVRAPDRERPYRAAGYPLVPLLYVVANVGVGIAMIMTRPVHCITSLGVLATGIPVYLVFARRRAS